MMIKGQFLPFDLILSIGKKKKGDYEVGLALLWLLSGF